MALRRTRKYALVRRSLKKRSWFEVVLCILIGASILYLAWLPDVTPLSNNNPRSTSLMRSRGHSEPMLNWTPISRIPRHIQSAVLVGEDFAFWSHEGFDLSEMWFAIRDALLSGRLPRGASTITQQLAKNLYLSTAYNPLRKVKEALITRRLEHELTKTRILELYLNVIEWGPGIYGIGRASQHYFKKSPAALTVDEAVYLASIIPNPLGASRRPRWVAARKRIIAARMGNFRH